MKVFQTPDIEEAGSDKCSSEIVLFFSVSPRPQACIVPSTVKVGQLTPIDEMKIIPYRHIQRLT